MEKQKQTTRRLFFSKWRLLWILIAAAWLFVLLKLFVGGIFEKNTSLVAAFSATDSGKISATVEVAARYPFEVREEEWQMELLGQLADAIGLTLNGEEETTVVATAQRQELTVSKEAKAASTKLQAVRLFTETEEKEEEKCYVYAKICLKESLETVLAYKQLIEKTMEQLLCTEISTTVQLEGDYPGYLTLDRRDEITAEILKVLAAEVVYEHRAEDLYTVYAYTAGLENYISVENQRINLHIAMSQDEENYRTILYLASPILPDTW